MSSDRSWSERKLQAPWYKILHPEKLPFRNKDGKNSKLHWLHTLSRQLQKLDSMAKKYLIKSEMGELRACASKEDQDDWVRKAHHTI